MEIDFIFVNVDQGYWDSAPKLLSRISSLEDINIYLLHSLHTHCIFSNTRSVRYQPLFYTLYFMLLNNVLLTTVIEMVEILDGRVRIAFS